MAGGVIVLLDYCIVLLMFNMCGRGRAWQGARVLGRGCVIVLLDYCIVLLMFNMCGRGRAWQGACMAGVCSFYRNFE